MVATAYQRGRLIGWDGRKWTYVDTGESIENERPCVRCGEMPTADGHDACLGHIEGVGSACCGHGAEEAIQMKTGESSG